MNLRKAQPGDLAAVAAIYEEAKAALREQGVDQWQDGYPNETSARADLKAGTCFVLTEDGGVVATACLDFGNEPTYDAIFEGAWQGDDKNYGFLHRVAVSGKIKGRGAASLFFEELKRQAAARGVTTLRGDTHRDNLPMQRAMEKNGFQRRGIIYLEDGSERLAYEFLIRGGVRDLTKTA